MGSFVAACRLQSSGSIVVVHGLSRSAASGIFLDQGSNLCPLHWQVDALPLHHPGSPFIVKVPMQLEMRGSRRNGGKKLEVTLA